MLLTSGTSQNILGNTKQAPQETKKLYVQAPFLKTRLKKIETMTQDYYASQLTSLGINLRPGSEHRGDSKPTQDASRRCKSIVYSTLISLPSSHSKQLRDLTLFYTKDGRRGLGGGGSIALRCLNITDQELSSVLIHEIGHLVDSSLLIGKDFAIVSSFLDFDTRLPKDDPSVVFYKLSWISESEKKEEVGELDFVSIYAASDPFEDFAETYTYYRLHGREFRILASSNEVLNEKYLFMKNYLFSGEEFGDLNKEVSLNPIARNYDVTVLPFL